MEYVKEGSTKENLILQGGPKISAAIGSINTLSEQMKELQKELALLMRKVKSLPVAATTKTQDASSFQPLGKKKNQSQAAGDAGKGLVPERGIHQ